MELVLQRYIDILSKLSGSVTATSLSFNADVKVEKERLVEEVLGVCN